MTESEHEISIGLLRQRDPAAFTRLVNEHQAAIARLCQGLGLRGADLPEARRFDAAANEQNDNAAAALQQVVENTHGTAASYY